MVRNVIGSVLALAGATAAVWSPFRAWYDGRPGRDIRVADLFGGIGATRADLWTSLLLPFVFAAVLTLVGVVLRSRLLVAIAGLVVLAFAVLWMVRQGQAAGSLSVESDGSGLGPGVALATGGGLLLLLGAAVMSGRARAREAHEPGAHGGWGRGHGHHRRGHTEPYQDPYAEPYDEPYAEPRRQPYAGDAPTAEYPRQDDRYGDRPADRPDDGYGPGEPGPGPDEPYRPGPPHRG
ncbi:hypothetical protein ACGF5F_21175 [Streptomyces sp. NPDC047821]|uniref:hypothetical protein n=1 Tax=Streptomyces sp. NPDC047821 TaxID=3365488 RepID=UPI0037188802